jgi:tRNA-dihydrouridine synthase
MSGSETAKYGYDFFKSVGSPRFISAPMVDQSSLSWRLLVKKHGTDLAYSQMMHARNYVNDKKYRDECIDWDNYDHASGDASLSEHARQLDSNLIVQLAGDDPDILAKAAQYTIESSDNVAAIDLNLGCPQKIAKRGHYGAYLLTDRQLIVSLLTALVKGSNKPITAKIRRLPTDADTLDLCRAIQECGVSMLTVHGRTVDNSKLYIKEADWDIIGKIKSELSIPVIANGGISSRDDALACLAYTGADGVMSSEALLENPKMFSEEGNAFFRDNYVLSQIQTTKEYLTIVQSYPLPRPLFQVVRGHLFKFLFRFVDAPSNQDLRRLLAEGTFEDMLRVVDIIEERLAVVNFCTKTAEEKGLLNTPGKTWYMRHRDDKSAMRVISPRRSAAPVVRSQTSEDEETVRLAKMEVLRRRLNTRKSSQI